MKRLNIHLIRTDGGTQSRLQLNQEVVNEYAEHMKEGDTFPPMVVFHDGSDYWLADGFHRLFAYKANGTSSLDVDVRPGTVEDAMEFSFGANDGSKRGLSNTPEDNRSIVTRMLSHPRWSGWSNSAIAKHVKVSAMTVGRIKKSLETPEETGDTRKYINKHGQEAEMNISNLKKKDDAPKEMPRAERPVGTKPDSSTVNEDKLTIAMMTDQLSELSSTISELSDENELLKDKIAIGQWNATEIEKMDIQDTVSELREKVRILEIDNKSLREGRDMYQNRNAELMRVNKSLTARIKKLEG